MTLEIVVAGFGGQGVLLTGKILCVAAMRQGYKVSHIPSYGAEMRGGTANCSVVISDEDIPSPVVEYPNVLIALNGPSLQKFEPRLRPKSRLIWNSSLIKKGPIRQDLQCLSIEASALSIAAGSDRAANMAALGMLLHLEAQFIPLKAIKSALDEVISERNRKHNPLNLRILKAGYDAYIKPKPTKKNKQKKSLIQTKKNPVSPVALGVRSHAPMGSHCS